MRFMGSDQPDSLSSHTYARQGLILVVQALVVGCIHTLVLIWLCGTQKDAPETGSQHSLSPGRDLYSYSRYLWSKSIRRVRLTSHLRSSPANQEALGQGSTYNGMPGG